MVWNFELYMVPLSLLIVFCVSCLTFVNSDGVESLVLYSITQLQLAFVLSVLPCRFTFWWCGTLSCIWCHSVCWLFCLCYRAGLHSDGVELWAVHGATQSPDCVHEKPASRADCGQPHERQGGKCKNNRKKVQGISTLLLKL